MGALSKKTEEEHLVLASGNRVYVLDGRHLEPIATREGRVTGLAVYQGRLVDSGDYHGIYDTISGEKLKFDNLWLGAQKWQDLASFEGRLVGVAMEKLAGDGRRVAYGYKRVFDLVKGKDIREDIHGSGAGTTHLLSSQGEVLAEAGMYQREAGSEVIETFPNGEEVIEYYYSSHPDIRTGSEHWASCEHLHDVWGSINGLVMEDETILFSDKKRIKKMERFGHETELVFQLEKEEGDLLGGLDILVGNPSYLGAIYPNREKSLYSLLTYWKGSEFLPDNFKELREKRWQEFRRLVFSNEEKFPSYIMRAVQHQTLEEAVVNCNKAPLKKWGENEGFGAGQEELFVRNPRYLFNLLRKSVDVMEKKYLGSNTVKGLATIGEDIYFGTSKRELHRVVSIDESELITGVPRPVAKMIAVSLPVFDEGIRQKVLQNKRRRAYYAKSVKKAHRLAA